MLASLSHLLHISASRLSLRIAGGVFTVPVFTLLAASTASSQTTNWTGEQSVDWNTAGNWDTNAVPSAGRVIINDDSANSASASGVAFDGSRLDVGAAAGSSGSLELINGSDFQLTSAYIGTDGTGTLSVDNSLLTSSGTIYIGTRGSGTVIVSGSEAALSVTGSSSHLNIGDRENGNGNFEVLDGATVTVGNVALGNLRGSGSLTVDGAGSSLSITRRDLSAAGATGDVSITVSNGGEIDILGTSGWLQLGSNADSVTRLLLTGEGSQISSTGYGLISEFGTVRARVEDQAHLAVGTSLILGASEDADGQLVIDSEGSVDVAQATSVGLDGGHGILTLSGDGTLTSIGPVFLSNVEASTGVLNIGAAAGAPAAAAGILDAPGVAFGVGTGTLVFNHTEPGYVFSTDLQSNTSGTHIIDHVAGTTILTGDGSGFTGTTNITGGTLLVGDQGGGGALGGIIDVQSGATLGGSGTVGTTNVAEDGRIAPGNSIGVLTVDGNLILSDGSFLDYELGSPGSSVGTGTSDRIDVTGDLTLDGTLNLAQSGDAGDGPAGFGYYRLMTYGGALSGDGLEIGATLSPSEYEIQAGGGNVDLFVQAMADDTLQHWQGGDGTWNATNERWLNRGSDVLVPWAGNHAVFMNEPGGFDDGTVTVEGTQSFKGLQFVDSGYRLEGPGTLVADGSESADGNAEIRVLAGETATIGATIGGSDGITKTEGGTLVLEGNNTYTGGTTVNAGALAVNGTVGGIVDVMSGGRLEGTGSVGTTTIAGGATIAPGNPLGALAIDGDITFEEGSSYEAEITPALESDLISVSGAAIINGGTVHALMADGIYTPGSRWTIISADEVAGTFDELTQNMPFVDLALGYDDNNVYIDALRNEVAFCDVAVTRNQCATGEGLESAGVGNPVYDAVSALADDEGARLAFDSLSGEIHASAKTSLIEESHFIRDAVRDRVRSAFGGAATSSLPVLAYGADGVQEFPAESGGPVIWGQAFGAWGQTDSNGNAAQLDRSVGGVLTGIDGAITPNIRLGLLAGYSHSSFDVDDRASSGSSDNFHIGLYGGGQWDAFRLSGGLAYSWHDIETDRGVAFPGFADTLSAGYDAGTFQVFGEAGYRFDTRGASFEPFVGLAHVSLHTDSFTENGGAAALGVDSRTTDATFMTLGLHASTDFEVGGMNATAHGTLGWRHAFGDITPLSTHDFSGGDAFTVSGVPIAENAALIRAGVDFDITDNATLGVSYRGQIASDAQEHGISAKLNMTF